MIDLNQILDRYPAELREYREEILREYLQYLLLAEIFSSPQANKLAFLGGTALRIAHGNSRFSEDLDFDNQGLKANDLQSLSATIEAKLKQRGLSVVVDSKINHNCRLKLRFVDLLHPLGLSPHRAARLVIHADFTPQNYSCGTDLVRLDKFGLDTTIRVVPPKTLLAQKLVTAFGRPRAMGRDFYDIVFLVEQNHQPDFAYLQQRIGVDSPTKLKRYIQTESAGLDFKSLANDVEPFVFKAADKDKTADFLSRLKGHLL